jgi:hypothetical protein
MYFHSYDARRPAATIFAIPETAPGFAAKGARATRGRLAHGGSGALSMMAAPFSSRRR